MLLPIMIAPAKKMEKMVRWGDEEVKLVGENDKVVRKWRGNLATLPFHVIPIQQGKNIIWKCQGQGQVFPTKTFNSSCTEHSK